MFGFHPVIGDWFLQRFGEATEPQRRAWPSLQSGRDALITAPTGSGKTLAAFLVCLDRLVKAAAADALVDQVQVLYVSPLKALSTDIHRNLDAPLAEIAAMAEARGMPLPPIRSMVRTGDTPAWERRQFVRRPPHILVTTPESLFILLTAERSRKALEAVRTVIVDEIHAVAGSKRGAHLALSVARLEDLVVKAGGAPPQRIGLSATVKPVDEVARLLRLERTTDGDPDRVVVVDVGHRRRLDIAVEIPKDELGVVASNEMWEEIYDRVAALVREHRTTLVFVNTRRLAERLAHHLTERLGEGAILAHHGSLSRRLRQTVERRLKDGDLRAVVATSSLELGIDIGFIDLVCQIGSPRSIAVALQRIGRAGHQVERAEGSAVPKGRLFATTRDELLECAALVRAIRRGLLDRLEMPRWPRDVLAQQIVAAVACEDWREEDLFRLATGTHSYRDLPRAEFDALIEMLSSGITTRRGRSGAYLHRDRVNGVVRGRRGARLAAITSGGAIPDNANYFVVAEPEGTTVGTVDEDFAVESLSGDVFLLGTTSWRIRRIEQGRVRVEDAHGAAPSVPFWRGEAPGRTRELSEELSAVRARLAEAEPHEDDLVAFLHDECGLDRGGALQAITYVRAGAGALGALPSSGTIVAERFFDEGGGMQLVLHAPFGARINRAWGLALRKRFCRSFNFELQAAATDNGLVISLAEQHSFPLEVVFKFLNVDTVESVLTQALLDSPMFTARWRWDATRALAVLRFAGGRKVPPPLQRMRSDDLLASVFPDQAACAENLVGEIRIPDHPLVNESIRDCLDEAMDLAGLTRVLAAIERGDIRTVAIDTAEPSPLSHEILNANPYAFLDDAPLEEHRARAVQMRRTLGAEASELGALDRDAIEQVGRDAWPIVRDADELHDALLTLVALPPVEDWRPWFEALAVSRRATCLTTAGTGLWAPAERLALARAAYPEGRPDPEIDALDDAGPGTDRAEAAVTEVVRGWLESTGPQTAAGLAARLALPVALVEHALLRLEGEGQILRGRFSSTMPAQGAEEWCNRRLLARIHRLTLGRLRREIEPVTAADLVRFLFRWQHLAPGSRLHGADGVLQIVTQLQGYEISAAAWETQILPRRVSGYTPEWLDELCLAGDLMWGRLSPHPALAAQSERSSAVDRRVRSGGVAPRSGLPDPDGRRALAGPTPEVVQEGLDATGDVQYGRLEPERGAGERSPRRIRPTRVARVSLFRRADAGWLIERASAAEGEVSPDETALSHPARDLLAALRRRGASFLSDLVRATGRLTSEVEDGLWELLTAGVVTADGFDNLRALVDPKRRRGEGRGRRRRPRHAAGRWALLRSTVEADPPVLPDDTRAATGDEERIDAFARQLLRRWGVVFRDLLAREVLAPPWRELLRVLRRMEARGEIRGGRFVDGFVGEQFASAEALDLLRIVRKQPHDVRIEVAAADPLNLVGIITPGPRVSALSGEQVSVVPEGAPTEATPAVDGAALMR